jgi:hypothetical protein
MKTLVTSYRSLWGGNHIADEGDPDGGNILTGMADQINEATKNTFDILEILGSSRSPRGAFLHLGYAAHRKLPKYGFCPCV